jgi:hypothetical protein
MNARGNGLRASAYAVLIEVDETTGARLLDALAERQIAAYVVPAPGPVGARRFILHVDASRRLPARSVLAGLMPAHAAEPGADAAETTADGAAEPASGHDADQIDALFSQLVAGFHDAPEVRSWPEAEDLPGEAPSPPAARPTDPWVRKPEPWDPVADGERRRRAAADRPDAGPDAVADPPTQAPPTAAQPPVVRKPPTPPAAAAGSGPRDYAVDEDPDDSHYVPPHLPKLRPTTAATRWAFTAMAFGLALLLVPTLLTLEHTTATDVAGVACILGATAFLLTRLRPDSSGSPDDPDDGAVV